MHNYTEGAAVVAAGGNPVEVVVTAATVRQTRFSSDNAAPQIFGCALHSLSKSAIWCDTGHKALCPVSRQAPGILMLTMPRAILRDRPLKTNSEKHSYCITLCCPHAPALDLSSALLLLLQSLKLRQRPADSHSKLHNNCMHAGGRPAEPTPY